MRFRSLLALLVLLAGTARADQTDLRLPALFDALLTAQEPAQAAAVEAEIWATWTAYPDPAVERLMAAAARDIASGALAAAEQRLDQVVTLAPDYAEGWNRRATLYYLLQRYEESLADIARVLALEPRHFGALAGQGLCLVALARPAEAAAAFRAALAINPHARGAAENLRFLEESLGRLI